MVNGNLAKSKIFSTIIKSALTAPETPPDAAKSWVDKVLKAAEDIKEGAIDDEKLAKAIAEYLENHPIESGITEQKAREIAQNVVDAYQEKDPTVPDWAKAETKPTYTAAEVGAVPESAKSDIDKNTSARHTHSNKSALDSISESDIAKWNSGTAGTVEITGATGLAAGSAPTVTEAADSTAQARKYTLGIPAGENGTDGADGKSAYQFAQEAGYTGTETEFGAKLNQTTFANPFPLTFTGAASATYDGSSAVTVDLPSGGGVSSIGVPFKRATLGDAEVLKISGFKAKKIVVFGEMMDKNPGVKGFKVSINENIYDYQAVVISALSNTELRPFYITITVVSANMVAIYLHNKPQDAYMSNTQKPEASLQKLTGGRTALDQITISTTNGKLVAETWMQVNIVEEA